MSFFFEVLISGLLAGTLYSLVALGFVLIFKASGVFNFAQGAMALFAALTLVRLMEFGAPILLAAAGTLLSMVVLAFLVERFVLRPLVNQPEISLFMATIGLNFLVEGFAQTVWGADVHTLDLGIPDTPIEFFGILLFSFDLVAAAVAGVMVTGLALFFQRTKSGRSLRAVADDHQAALSVGIPLHWVWITVWTAAGIVAMVAGAVWGSKLGVQFSIALIAFKAIPVIIIGGLTSVPGAIVAGLLVGAGEKLSEVYIGPALGGAVESWFPYALAVVVLIFRPAGLFGERIIERV